METKLSVRHGTARDGVVASYQPYARERVNNNRADYVTARLPRVRARLNVNKAIGTARLLATHHTPERARVLMGQIYRYRFASNNGPSARDQYKRRLCHSTTVSCARARIQKKISLCQHSTLLAMRPSAREQMKNKVYFGTARLPIMRARTPHQN